MWLAQKKFFPITASGRATSVKSGLGFVGCWERTESLYICSFAPLWLCPTGRSVTAAARIRITAVLELSPRVPLWKNVELSYRKPTPWSGNEDPTFSPLLVLSQLLGFAALWAICEMNASCSVQSLAQQTDTKHFAASGNQRLTDTCELALTASASICCSRLFGFLVRCSVGCLRCLSADSPGWSGCEEEEQRNW